MCPCCSGKEYSECCEPIIKGTRKAATPAELMRSRYSAYAKAEIDHIEWSTLSSLATSHVVVRGSCSQLVIVNF